MNTHPWLVALAGGVLIGVAAALLLGLNGRIAGVSNIAGGLVGPWWRPDAAGAAQRYELPWRLAFLVGLIAGAGLAGSWLGAQALQRPDVPIWLLAAAGVLVGYGTSLGRGCTSGHGVCGLARLSLRSLVATLVFLAVAIVTTFVVRHGFGVAT